MSVRRPGPMALAMIVCDTVLEDKKTHKKSLIGLFNSIHAEKAPVRHPRLSVLVVLTEGNGHYPLTLRCVRSDNEETLAEMRGEINFRSPQDILEVTFEILGLVLPAFGEYRLDFYCGNEPLISRKFRLGQERPA